LNIEYFSEPNLVGVFSAAYSTLISRHSSVVFSCGVPGIIRLTSKCIVEPKRTFNGEAMGTIAQSEQTEEQRSRRE